MTIIRFKIGDAFPASDPVARFLTGLAMISNDWLRSIEEMLKLGDALPHRTRDDQQRLAAVNRGNVEAGRRG